MYDVTKQPSKGMSLDDFWIYIIYGETSFGFNERGFTRNRIAVDRLNTDILLNTSPIDNPKPSGLRPSDVVYHTDAYVKFN